MLGVGILSVGQPDALRASSTGVSRVLEATLIGESNAPVAFLFGSSKLPLVASAKGKRCLYFLLTTWSPSKIAILQFQSLQLGALDLTQPLFVEELIIESSSLPRRLKVDSIVHYLSHYVPGALDAINLSQDEENE